MALQGLNKREIQVIADTNRDNYSIKIYSQEAGLWQLDIELSNPPRLYQAFTNRGDLKTWRELSGAVGYIQEICPDCRMVEISVGQWTFTRTDQDKSA